VSAGQAGQTTTIDYADVQKIQGPGLSMGAKIGIAVVVAVAVVAIVVGVAYSRTKVGPL
jgi:uncharacterized membrane protein (Fun14 family)